MKAMPTPEPMSLEDIDQAITDYGLAAERCRQQALTLSSSLCVRLSSASF